MRYPIFFGIDLTSTETKPSACLGLDAYSQPVYIGSLARNSDIVALLEFYSPQLVAIDAPLSLPLGLCCLEETCSCKPASSSKNRQCDRELRQLGIPCYPTTKKTFIRDLIRRGIELKATIEQEFQQGSQVIEVYPFASMVCLFGNTVPRKTTRAGLSSLRERLRTILPGLGPYLDFFNHDLCDAALAAYTALLYHKKRAKALGNKKEGLIFIPD